PILERVREAAQLRPPVASGRTLGAIVHRAKEPLSERQPVVYQEILPGITANAVRPQAFVVSPQHSLFPPSFDALLAGPERRAEVDEILRTQMHRRALPVDQICLVGSRIIRTEEVSEIGIAVDERDLLEPHEPRLEMPFPHD